MNKFINTISIDDNTYQDYSKIIVKTSKIQVPDKPFPERSIGILSKVPITVSMPTMKSAVIQYSDVEMITFHANAVVILLMRH